MKPDFKLYRAWGKDDDDFEAFAYRDLFFIGPDGAYKDFHAGKGWMDTNEVEHLFGGSIFCNNVAPITIYQGDWHSDYCEFATLYLDRYQLRLNKGKTQPHKPKGEQPKGEKIVCKSYKMRRLSSGEIELTIFK